MKLRFFSIALLGLLGPVPFASAQNFGAPQASPTVSPYLNMLRPGSVTLNYMGLVQPQVNSTRNIANLQQSINTLQNQQNLLVDNQGAPSDMITTGHPVAFQTTVGYFNRYGAKNGNTGLGQRGGIVGPTSGNLGSANSLTRR